MVKPIKPSEAKKVKVKNIPEFIIAAFNKFIADNLDTSGRSSFKQKHLVTYIVENQIINDHQPVSASIIYQNKWLDVEDLFEDAGWSVTYDSPSWGDNYDAYFVFVDNSKSKPTSDGWI